MKNGKNIIQANIQKNPPFLLFFVLLSVQYSPVPGIPTDAVFLPSLFTLYLTSFVPTLKPTDFLFSFNLNPLPKLILFPNLKPTSISLYYFINHSILYL